MQLLSKMTGVVWLLEEGFVRDDLRHEGLAVVALGVDGVDVLAHQVEETVVFELPHHQQQVFFLALVLLHLS
jgi:hypothetical protein